MQVSQFLNQLNLFWPNNKSPLHEPFLLTADNPALADSPTEQPFIYINTIEFEENNVFLYYKEHPSNSITWQTLDKAITSLDLVRILKCFGQKNQFIKLRNSEAFYNLRGIALFNRFYDLHGHWNRHSQNFGLLLSC